jgi:LysM repeat protein
MHIVKPGETLFQLSRQYEKSVEEIMGYNKIPNSNLGIGQKLKIPQK